MILSSRVVEQSIDRDDRGRFVKELVMVEGDVPLALVRKRAATRTGAAAESRASVLLVHGYGQNRHAFHLPLRSMANHLARAGYDVFNLDLRGQGRSAHFGAHPPADPAEWVRNDMPRAVAEVRTLTGGLPLFLVGHSLGGLVCYGAAPALRGSIAGVAGLGSPYHFLRGQRVLSYVGKLLALVEPRLPKREVAMPLRTVGELARAFRSFIESPLYPLPVRGYSPGNIEHDVLAQHMAMAMDLASVRVLREMFRWAREREKNANAAGGVEGFGESFEALTDVPLLVVAGSHDDLAPPAAVRTAYERSQARDKTYRCFPAGHIDLLVGQTAPQTTWALLEAWLRQRS